jgi:peptide/nickel transport system ATP-binding protein
MIAMKNLLNVEDLTLRFYTYAGIVEALDGVNLNLREGETLGLVGETGCGKSVTGLSTMVLVPTPGKIEGGRIFFQPKDESLDLLLQDEAFLRSVRGKDISMIFQEPRVYLNPVYTVRNQIAEVLSHHRIKELSGKILDDLEAEVKRGKRSFRNGLERIAFEKMHGNPNSFFLRIISRIPIVNRYQHKLNKEIDKEVIRILKEMEIPDPKRVAEMYPHELSGGMAQRVVIAMSLACNPILLIADEPTTNLDVTVQAQILNLVRRLKERFGSSILYVTHDMGVVAELCQRVAVMYAGNVCELADVMEIFKNPLHPYTKALLESIPRPGKEFKSIEGTVPSLINPPKGCRFHDRCQKATEKCSNEKPRLVEVKKDHFVQCHLYTRVSK